MDTQSLHPPSIQPRPSERTSWDTLFFLLGVPHIYGALRSQRLHRSSMVSRRRYLRAVLVAAAIATILEAFLL
jgi:hypothetical protein